MLIKYANTDGLVTYDTHTHTHDCILNGIAMQVWDFELVFYEI